MRSRAAEGGAAEEARDLARSPGRLTGLILAGGASRRMGGVAKAFLPVEGREMIRRVADRMEAVCAEVRIAAGAGHPNLEELASLGCPLVFDAFADGGPLAGLLAGLSAAGEGIVWASACDMPFVSAEAAVWMGERLERTRGGEMAAVPEIGGRLHPLQAVYRAECSREAKACLARGERRLTEFARRIRPLVIREEEFAAAGIDLRFVANVNTPEEYRQALADI
ncbi:molybdenum cofactor guanylyltransferase [Cohnella xylanilytica]|uniref:Probable molybdenum cofactor guanylyltransferase n=1 Tax=Cohnella xylanilytica TaxID=557555 RepID=A0A841TXB0_9BACL|nr:molybdenum cofactor guanylyltransferase [Cohnella xylanilytica]MBB6690581.1 molybdenum cofactor guanylyltransferase [Cohnella xylanilytica]GIO14184.1 molybdenum cofactor guanylyltransferase [Cohnella xylanilytica]